MSNLFGNSPAVYTPDNGLFINSNFLIFLLILLGLSVFYGIIFRYTKTPTEISDLFIIGLLYAFLIVTTRQIRFVHGDPIIICMMMCIFGVIFKRVLNYIQVSLDSIVLMTCSSVLFFEVVKNEMILNDLYNKLTLLRNIFSALRIVYE